MSNRIRVYLLSVLFKGGMAFALSLTVVIAGILLGPRFLSEESVILLNNNSRPHGDWSAWDGKWYLQIADKGYNYSDVTPSSIVFFPLYPLAVRALQSVIRLPTVLGLVIVANLCRLISLVLFVEYLQVRQTRSGGNVRTSSGLAVICMCLYPPAFFHHMAYSESTFLMCVVAAMYLMERKAHPLIVALVIGAATAARFVGVALLIPYVYYVVHRFHAAHMVAGKHWPLGVVAYGSELFLYVPIALSGLMAFVFYQNYKFGEPLAFAKAQTVWRERRMPASQVDRFIALATFEPVRAVYSSNCECDWSAKPPNEPWWNLQFANPIYFVGGLLLILVGAACGWLTGGEIGLGLALLLIPYVAQSYRMCMISQARFTSVVFPIYIVLSKLLAMLPRAFTIYLLICAAIMMAGYAAMFTSWYPLL